MTDLALQWKILASAQTLIAFLHGYTIFLGPMTSIIMTEYVHPTFCSLDRSISRLTSDSISSYYILRRGKVSVPDMYNFHGIYRYSQKWGTNWRAVAAFFIGCIPPLPGFVDNIVKAGGSTTSVSTEGQHL